MRTVLIVEDNVQLCSFYSRIVEHAGLNAAAAYSCREALDYLMQELPRLILLDMSLPDGSGQLVIDYLRTLPDHEVTHIAVVTGESQYKRWAAEMEVDTFLVKPVSSPALLDLVSRYAVAA